MKVWRNVSNKKNESMEKGKYGKVWKSESIEK